MNAGDLYTKLQGDRLNDLAAKVGSLVATRDQLPARAATHALQAYTRMMELGKQLRFLSESIRRNPAQQDTLVHASMPALARSIDQAEEQLQRADPSTWRDYRNTHARAVSMGIWSFNPNKWFLTQDEALEYDKKQAEAAAAVADLENKTALEIAKTEQQVQTYSPTFWATVSETGQSAVRTIGFAQKVMIFGALAIGGWWLYATLKPAQ